METKKSKKAASPAAAAVIEATPASVPRLFGSIPAMIDEATQLIEMADKHDGRLETHGWTPADTDDQRSKLKKFFALHGKFTSRKKANQKATAKFKSTWGEADQFRSRLQGGLQVLALTDPTVLGSVDLRSSEVKTPQKLLQRLSAVTDVVSQNAAALKIHLGEDPVEALARHLTDLTKALGGQRERLASRASLSKEQKRAVDALAFSVMRLRRIGRIAFAKDKALLKELTRRSGKKKAVGKGTGAQASGTPAPAAPPGPAAATAAAVAPEKPAAAAPAGQAAGAAQ